MRKIRSVLLLVNFFLATEAYAGDLDWSDCSSGVHERINRGCSAILEQGGKISEKQRAVAFSNRGTAFYETGQLELALKDFSEAIRLDPNYAEAFYARGVSLLGVGRVDEAIIDLTRALKLNAKSANVFNALGNAHRARGDADKALQHYNEALAINPRLVFALIGRGSIRREKGDLDRALSDYSEAVRINGKYASSFIGRGNVQLDRNKPTEALRDFDKALELDPKSAEAFNNRSYAYRILGKTDKALDDQTRAVELDPKNPRLLFNRGLILNAVGRYDAALTDFSASIQLNERFPVAYQARGAIYLARGDLEHALADLDRAIALNEKLPLAFLLRAKARLIRSEFKLAERDFSQSISLDPKKPSAYLGRGLAYEGLGNLQDARADFGSAINLNQKLADAYFHRGLIEKAQKDLGQAKKDFAEAARLEPSVSEFKDAVNAIAASEVRENPPEVIPPSLAVGKLNRVALIIGNDSYRSVPKLSNPVRDANAFALALSKIGFRSVEVKQDLTQSETMKALEKFAEEADRADWAVVYYAGHGMEIAGTNYLIPVDAELKSDSQVQYQAVPVSLVLNALGHTKQLRLVILDACRDNPFLSKMQSVVASRSISRGLAREEPSEGGTLIAFSAKHGQVALDGGGEHSPFVSALLRRLATPGIEIRKLFGLVRDDVLALTGGKQEPYVYGTLGGDDYVWHPPQEK